MIKVIHMHFSDLHFVVIQFQVTFPAFVNTVIKFLLCPFLVLQCTKKS